MANAADIVVNLVAKTGRLTRPMQRAERSVRSFRRESHFLTKELAKAAAVGFASVLTARAIAFAAITKAAAKANDELGKFATRIGVAADSLRELQIAADRTGVTSQQLNIGLQRMTRRVAEVAAGTGEAQKAMKDLGLDAREIASLPVDQQFHRIAEAITSANGRAEQIRLTFKLFDSEGVGLLNTMQQLATGGIADVLREAREMNAIIGDFDVAKFESASDEFNRMKLATQGISNTIGRSLLPFVHQLANGFVGVSRSMADVNSNANHLGMLMSWIISMTFGLGRAFKVLGAKVAEAGLLVLEKFATPLSFAEKAIRNIVNFQAKITGAEPLLGDNTYFESVQLRIEEIRKELEDLRQEGVLEAAQKGAGDYAQAWVDARLEIERQADAILAGRLAARQTAGEVNRITGAAEVASVAAEKEAKKRSEINSIIASTYTTEEKALSNITRLTQEINSVEKERADLIEAQKTLIDSIRTDINLDVFYKSDTGTLRGVIEAVPDVDTVRVAFEFDRTLRDLESVLSSLPVEHRAVVQIAARRAELDGLLRDLPDDHSMDVAVDVARRSLDRLIADLPADHPMAITVDAHRDAMDRLIADLPRDHDMTLRVATARQALDNLLVSLPNDHRFVVEVEAQRDALDSLLRDLPNAHDMTISVRALRDDLDALIETLPADHAFGIQAMTQRDELDALLADLPEGYALSIAVDAQRRELDALLESMPEDARLLYAVETERNSLDDLLRDLPSERTLIVETVARAEALARLLDSVPESVGIGVDFTAQRAQLDTVLSQIPDTIPLTVNIAADATKIEQLAAQVARVDQLTAQINQHVATGARLEKERAEFSKTHVAQTQTLAEFERQIVANEQALNATQVERTNLLEQQRALLATVLTTSAADAQALVDVFERMPELASQFAAIQTRILQGEAVHNELITAREALQEKVNQAKMREADAIVQSQQTQQERLQKQIDELQEAITNRTVTDVSAAEEAIERLKTKLDELNDKADPLTQFGIQMARNLQTSFAQILSSWDGTTSGMRDSFVRMLRDMVAQLLARQILLSFFGLFAKSGGGLGNFANAILKGFAAGGPIAARQAALVGERGPELFIPNTSGTIIPNNKLGGGASVNITNTYVFEGGGDLDIATLIPILEDNNRRLKADIMDGMDRGEF